MGGKHEPANDTLIRVAADEGFPGDVIHPVDFKLGTGSALTLEFADRVWDRSPWSVIMPRIGACWVTDGGYKVMRQLQRMGGTFVNDPRAIAIAEDKHDTNVAFTHAQIPCPTTLFSPAETRIVPADSPLLLGAGNKIVCKPNSGTAGSRALRVVDATDSVTFGPRRKFQQSLNTD